MSTIATHTIGNPEIITIGLILVIYNAAYDKILWFFYKYHL